MKKSRLVTGDILAQMNAGFSSARMFFLSFFFCSTLVFLAHFAVVGQSVYGDGRSYFMYLKSMLVDGTLDISDELGRSWSLPNTHARTDEKEVLAPLQYPLQSMGPSVVLTPFLLPIHIFLQFLEFAGVPVVANGYSTPYQVVAGLMLVVFAGLGLAITFLGLRRLVSQNHAVAALAFLWLTTNLFFYSSIDVVNTHPFSFFASSVLWYLLYFRVRRPFLVGLMLGLMMVNRTNDLAFFLPAVIISLFSGEYATQRHRLRVCGIAAIAAMPQFLVWHLQTGSFFPPTSDGSFWNLSPVSIIANLIKVCAAFPQGVLFSSPIVLLGFWGFFRYSKEVRRFAPGVVLFFLIVCSWYDPFAGESYGVRLLIVLYPLVAYGLGLFFSRFQGKLPILFLLCLFTVLNMLNILLFLLSHSGGQEGGWDTRFLEWMHSIEISNTLPRGTMI